MNRQIITISVIVLATIGLIVHFTCRDPLGAIEPKNLLKVSTEDVIRSKVVQGKECIEFEKTATSTGQCIEYEEKEFVKYLYNTKEEVIVYKAEGLDEDVSQRTKNTRFFPKENGEIVMDIYGGLPFHKDGNDWYQIREDIIPKEDFDTQIGELGLLRLFVTEVFAYDDYPVGAGDDALYYEKGAWDTMHDATTATGARQPTEYTFAGGYDYGDGRWTWQRGTYPVDTSGIDDGLDVLSASFFIYVHNAVYTDNDEYAYIVFVETTIADPTANPPSTADWNQIGAVDNPTPITGEYMIDELTTSAYNEFVLTSFDAIDKGDGDGWTQLGVREGHDAEDVPTDAGAGSTQAGGQFNGAANTPYLRVTVGAADTCTCPAAGGDWYVDSSDSCFLIANCDLDTGGLYILNTGEGSFNIIDNAELSITSLNNTSTPINVKAGSKINFK